MFVVQVSGTLPNSFSNMSNIRELYLYDSKFSGSLPAEWSQLQKLAVLFLHNNHLSATISNKLSQLTRVSTFHIGGNPMIQGSIPSGFHNMTQMRNFLCNGIKELSFDLKIVKSWSSLQHLVISETATRGTIPADMLTNSTNISTFLMARTQISSTIPEQSVFPPSVDLSGSKLSGVLPPNAVNIGTKGLLINDLKLSGSLPVSNTRQMNSITEPITFAASRGYFTGRIPDQFNSKLGFETLILSSNRFACNVPGMDGAVNLGVGDFVEPVEAALKAIGNNFVKEQSKVLTSPFASLSSTYKNAVLVFAGNPYLETNAGRVSGWTGSGIPASRVVEKDVIVQGRVSVFTEYSSFKQTIGLVLPGLFLLHFVAAAIAVCHHKESFAAYFRRDLQLETIHRLAGGTLVNILEQSISPLSLLAVCGVSIGILYAQTPSVYNQETELDETECADPFLRLTAAPCKAGLLFQWAWAFLASASSVCVAYLYSNIKRCKSPSSVMSAASWLRAIHNMLQNKPELMWAIRVSPEVRQILGEFLHNLLGLETFKQSSTGYSDFELVFQSMNTVTCHVGGIFHSHVTGDDPFTVTWEEFAAILVECDASLEEVDKSVVKRALQTWQNEMPGRKRCLADCDAWPVSYILLHFPFLFIASVPAFGFVSLQLPQHLCSVWVPVAGACPGKETIPCFCPELSLAS